MAEHTRYALVMHFDSASGMVYEQGPNLDNRRARTVETEAWWENRLAILKALVFPSIARQAFQGFDVWCLFDKRDLVRAQATWAFCEAAGAHCTVEGPAALRHHYLKAGGSSGACMQWLVVVHQDSDDLYGPEAMGVFSACEPSPGAVWYFDRGFVFGLGCGRLALFNADKGGPPPFHAMAYSREALADGLSWQAYRETWGLSHFHHQLLAAKNIKRVGAGGRHFCVLVHGSNTTTSWDNRHTAHHTGGEVTEAEQRHQVAEAFGLAAWATQKPQDGLGQADSADGQGKGELQDSGAAGRQGGPQEGIG